MGTIKTTNIEPIADNGTVTLGSSGDTFTVPSGVTITNNGTQTGFGGTNECIWFASQNGDQTISHNSNTKVAFSNQVIDTDSAYDPSTNYRFTVPSGKGGTYRVDFGFWVYDSGSNLQQAVGYIYKNGSDLFNIRSQHNAVGEYAAYVNMSSVITLSAGDYLEVYCYGQESSSSTFVISGSGNSAIFRNFFSGYKLIT